MWTGRDVRGEWMDPAREFKGEQNVIESMNRKLTERHTRTLQSRLGNCWVLDHEGVPKLER